jgi:hypothetical protein
VTSTEFYSEHDIFFKNFDEKFGYTPPIINHVDYEDMFDHVIDTDEEYYNGYNYDDLFEILG